MGTHKKLKQKFQAYLSHKPMLYALIVGIGIVLFWRGVWHTADSIHSFIDYAYFSSSIDLTLGKWWDGPLSFIVGVFMLHTTGAFTSSFIGNELILSGLRGERRLNERTEADLKSEINTIGEVKEELVYISKKLEKLEKEAGRTHTKL